MCSKFFNSMKMQVKSQNHPITTHPSDILDITKYKVEWLDPEELHILDIIKHGTYGYFNRGYYRQMGGDCMIRTAHAEDAEKVTKEMAIINHLKMCPYVVPCYGAFRSLDQQNMYVVTNYFEESDINNLSAAEIQKHMRELFCGLEFCHRKGIVHCHLSSKSIIIDKHYPKLVIIDWGGAELMNSGTKLGPNIGEEGYRAPEVLLELSKVDGAIDMWAAGCILAGMIYRKQPFFQRTEEECEFGSVMSIFGSRVLLEMLRQTDYKDDVPLRLGVFAYLHNNFEKYLKEEKHMALSKEALSMLNKCLECDPKKRISANEAMNCLFFFSNPKLSLFKN